MNEIHFHHEGKTLAMVIKSLALVVHMEELVLLVVEEYRRAGRRADRHQSKSLIKGRNFVWLSNRNESVSLSSKSIVKLVQHDWLTNQLVMKTRCSR